ncbi:hypothetical protein [Phenylobacterium deserti]|uniref:Pyridoxamine 5'-phosphate oxidase putative domain-containing protein n=1 Tax=Phenylobacterium deserti TaxID=1914756 RepID=A0A328ADD4_9CAUL|nr:hypothetical protein [Phenylobacterium deserti]RAK51414.1 hypothetical protein DJ018_15870 [Phenylobacterium deserti]
MAIGQAAEAKLAAFLAGPVMLVASVADPAARAATIGRVMGVRRAPPASLDLFIAGGQWTRMVESVRVGQALALTLCRPATYQTLQLKGPVTALVRADPAGAAVAHGYAEVTGAHLGALGVDASQMRPWLRTDDLVQVTFTPQEAFEQTPGPHAGSPMAFG